MSNTNFNINDRRITCTMYTYIYTAMHADKISCTSIVTVSNDKQYTTLKYDLIITTSYCMYPYSFKIHKNVQQFSDPR